MPPKLAHCVVESTLGNHGNDFDDVMMYPKEGVVYMDDIPRLSMGQARIRRQMYPKGGKYPRGEINQYTHQTRPPFLG